MLWIVLSIYLSIWGCITWISQLCTHHLHQLCPHLTNKPRVAIRQQPLGQIIHMNNVCEKDSCNRLSIGCLPNRIRISILGKWWITTKIAYFSYSISKLVRKPNDALSPLNGRHVNRLQQAWSPSICYFCPLTNVTGLYVCLHLCSHLWKPIFFL